MRTISSLGSANDSTAEGIIAASTAKNAAKFAESANSQASTSLTATRKVRFGLGFTDGSHEEIN
jgi:hypothetical protein